MTTAPMFRHIGLVAVAALLASSVAVTPLHAVDNDKSKTTTGNTTNTKKKTTDRKSSSGRTGTVQQDGSRAAAPSMSGYRPDPVTNY